MRLSVSVWAGRLLSPRLYARAEPFLQRIDRTLTGADERARTQQMAIKTFAIRVMGAVLAYASQVLLARWLGSFDYGIFVVVWTWMLILTALTALGFQTSVIRFIPEYEARGEWDLLRGLLISSRALSLAFATGLAAIGCLGVYLFEDFVTHYYVMPIYLIAICLPLFTLFEVQDGIARSQNWTDLSVTANYICRPALLLLALVGAGFAGLELNAETACYAAILTTYSISICQFLILRRRLKRVVPAGPNRFQTAHWVKVSLPIFMVEGFFALLTGSDVVIVSQFLPPESVAVYYAAAKTLAIIHFVYFAVKAASGHRFSKLYYSGDQTGFETAVRDAVHWTFWPSLAAAAFLLVIGNQLLCLFGEGFEAGYPLMFILVVGILARASAGPVDVLLNMSGHQKICAAVYGATFIANIGLNFLLIPQFGLAGAAAATSIAMIFETFALIAVVKRKLGVFLPGAFVQSAIGPSPVKPEESGS
ncbi:MAG: lipopolysaccharide biosynthesis protein [Pseudomonadota bacterium]